MRFEFATATRIVFGAGCASQLGNLVKDLGRKPLVVTGRNPQRAASLLARLAAEGMAGVGFAVPGEPTTDCVEEGVALARKAGCDFVVAFGGGSAIDAAKAIGALLANEGCLLDYLEVIGRAQPLRRPSLPVVAIPTTAGTGCEVTRNAVLASPQHRFKVSLRSIHLLPRIAIVDPEHTFGLPPEISASTGLDALTQLIEPFVSARANPLTDALCVEGIRRVARSLRKACGLTVDVAAREDMALASLLGGMALANAGLGAVHGFAAPIGGMFPAPHGAVCAALLPHVMQANVRALRADKLGGTILQRFEQVAEMLAGRSGASAEDGARWVASLAGDLRIPPLRQYGVGREDIPILVEKALQASSMKGNPVALDRETLADVLSRAL